MDSSLVSDNPKPQRPRPKTGYELNAYSQRKLHNEIHSVKPFKRFLDDKQYASGIDPKAGVSQFIKTDVIKPMEREKIYQKTFSTEGNRTERRPVTAKWSLGCTKYPFDANTIPKIQQYTQYNFYKPNKAESEAFRKRTLPTDHLGVQLKNGKGKDIGFLKTKAEYNIQSDSNSYWVPYHKGVSVNNVSSKNYNIINFQPLNNKMIDLTSLVTAKNINNKNKGVTEFADLTRKYRPNFNADFQRYYNENPKRFFKYKGIFSNMYDVSKRTGGISKPFG